MTETPRDPDPPSGLPDDEPEATPLGLDDESADAPESGDEAMPGIQTGEPDAGG